MKIRDVRVRAVAAPMKRPLATSTGKLTLAPLVLIDLETDSGVTGRAYLFAIGRHNLAPIARLVEAMADMVKGDEVSPFDLERKLRARYTLLGVHNIVLFAIAGIDMAASSPAYNSKGLGILPEKELVKEAVELLEEGFRAVKLRMGRPEARDDLNMLGVGWVAVKPDPMWGEELYAATFVAPKLSFFQRLLPMAEDVVKSARIKAAPRS